MCDCKNSVAKDFDPGNRGLSQRHVPPVETLRCFISAAKEVTPFQSRACVGETGASCYNFHSKSIFRKNMQAQDFL